MQTNPFFLLRTAVVILLGGGLLPEARGFPDSPNQLPSGHYSPRFRISREATFITEPLDSEGYPDYEEALNRHLSKGVTPEENAFAKMMEIIGPISNGNMVLREAQKAPHNPRFYSLLKIDPPESSNKPFLYLNPFMNKSFPEVLSSKKPSFEEIQKAAKTRPWNPKDYPAFFQWLAENEKALLIAEEASRKKGYFCPMVDAYKGEPMGGLGGVSVSIQKIYQEITEAFVYRAMLKIGQGKYEDAKSDLLVAHRLARLMLKGPMTFDYSLERLASMGDLVLLETGNVSKSFLQTWRMEFKELPPLSSPVDYLDWNHRVSVLETITTLNRFGMEYADVILGYEGRFPPAEIQKIDDICSNNINYHLLLKTYNSWVDQNVQAMKKPDDPAREKELKVILDNTRKEITRVHSFSNFQKLRSLKGEELANGGAEAHAFNLIQLAVELPNRFQKAFLETKELHSRVVLAMDRASQMAEK